jgi:hypothetical protein
MWQEVVLTMVLLGGAVGLLLDPALCQLVAIPPGALLCATKRLLGISNNDKGAPPPGWVEPEQWAADMACTTSHKERETPPNSLQNAATLRFL